ncbi:MAG: RNA methyltransferase [Bacteroidia bacterium]|nr:RNA methyltransferase [Bacteroidia bacterium]
MISKKKAKFIISLQKKKVRDEERLFIIEGDKLVKEFLAAKIPVKTLIARPEFLSSLPDDLTRFVNEIEDVSYEELKQISTLKTPHNALAIIPVPDRNLDTNDVLKGLCVALDFVQDPGNLGTIIRAAAWFGIKNIVCSEDCVDVYNPKVIQASMGALLNVSVFYNDLKKLFTSAAKNKIPIFGTMLEGDSIYNHKLDNKGIILLGNESKGISDELIPFITEKIMIPKFSKAKQGIDSLNVGMAASVVFYEFLRKSGRLPE